MIRRFLFITLLVTLDMTAQELPYHQIPDAPESYTAGNVISRMVDGLGYRYYWATEGLTETDIQFKPSEDARTVWETLQHIYGMSEIILNVPEATPNERPKDFSGHSFETLRAMTLNNLKTASAKYRNGTESELEGYQVIFQRGDAQFDFPLWNMLNGMLSDCIYHVGQIVAFRRMSGNPLDPKVNVFLGKNRE
ncbi:hypothetical protein ABV409_05205 [Flagellimonas sp. DF-77]|uniref:DinB family protein n=1 Tax=Flagellimonas algarum TaxID=3230298 RepID=UPI0033918ECF